jgi:hypothetical protein
MKHERYEINPRPLNVGGGYQLHLIGRDLETGEEVFLGGAVFPVDAPEEDAEVLGDAMETGEGWVVLRSENEE